MWWQVLLDRGRDDTLGAGAPLHLLDARIERSHRNDGLRPGRVKHLLELAFAVSGIHADDDGADLPRTKLGDEELRAVRQQQRDAVALADSKTPERSCEGRALLIELAV